MRSVRLSADIELRHLRAFAAVAEELNFSRAAERLHVVQQSLSGQIRDLEEELGVRLFQRTTRKVELTAAGSVFLAHAEAILAAMTTAVEQTRRVSSGDGGPLAIAYTPTVAAESLPVIVEEVHRRYPEQHLQMCEMWQAEIVAGVKAGRFDVGFARWPVLEDGLDCVSIREEPLGLILGAAHPLAASEIVPLRHLLHTKMAIWPRSLSPEFFEQVVGFFRGYGFDGDILEFENLASGVFYSDPPSRREIAAGNAFSIAFVTQFDPVPTGFAWRPVDPCPYVPLHMLWRTPCQAATHNFLRLAQEVSDRRGWLTPALASKRP